MILFNDNIKQIFVILFVIGAFFYILSSVAIIIGEKKATPMRTSLTLLAGLILSVILIQYVATKQNEVKTQLQESSKTVTVKTLESKLATSILDQDFIIVNDEYKIATSTALPKGATIIIQKYQSEPYYYLVKYEVK